MENRKQKVKELMDNFRSLRRIMSFHTTGTTHIPRITPAQWSVLMVVEGQGESTVKEIAEALKITSSAATQLVDGLVTSGYLIRKTYAQDRRIIKITLSKKTKTQVEKMKKQSLKKFLEVFEVLNDKEFNQYILLNKKIVERLLKTKPI